MKRVIISFMILLVTGCVSIGPGEERMRAARESEASGNPRPYDPTPSPSPSPTPAQPAALPALDWKNDAWTAALMASIRETGLPAALPADTAEFCPKYPKLDHDARARFWAEFLVAISKRESNYKPSTTYQEAFNDAKGKPVISTGLFQISQESASQSAYGCGKMTTEGLKDPVTNIRCATKIIARWVHRDGHAAGKKGENIGCGRYFAVCRPGTSRDYIKARTSALTICR